MNGPELLEHAAELVNRRRREYGEPVDVFEQVAERWSLAFGTKLSTAQVALCAPRLKLVRLTRIRSTSTARSTSPATPPACGRSRDDFSRGLPLVPRRRRHAPRHRSSS